MELNELVKQTGTLASLPEACIRLNEMFDDPHYSATDLGEVLARDPALSAQVLKIVNSAFYNFMSSIDTVSRAITVIGMNDLRSLVLAASATRAFCRLPNDLVSMDSFWAHSVFTAACARMLAKHCNVMHPERLFVAGLLHDVGHLMLYHFLPRDMMDVLLIANENRELIAQAEQDRFGFDHAEAGAALLSAWKLPDHLVECVKYHHNPEVLDGNKVDAHIVYLANRMSDVAEYGDSLEELMLRLNPETLAVLKVNQGDIADILEQVPEVYIEARALIMPTARRESA